MQIIAYTAATLLGGISALVALGGVLAGGESALLDVLLWGALAVLLFGSAVHEWWFAGLAADRSGRVAHEISSDEVEATARESTGQVDTVRRLRVAHPKLSLRDAYELARAHGPLSR